MVAVPTVRQLRQNPRFTEVKTSSGNVVFRQQPEEYQRERQGRDVKKGTYVPQEYEFTPSGELVRGEVRAVRVVFQSRSGKNRQQSVEPVEVFIRNPDGTIEQRVYEFSTNKAGTRETRRLFERNVIQPETGQSQLVEQRIKLTPTQIRNREYREFKKVARVAGVSTDREFFNTLSQKDIEAIKGRAERIQRGVEAERQPTGFVPETTAEQAALLQVSQQLVRGSEGFEALRSRRLAEVRQQVTEAQEVTVPVAGGRLLATTVVTPMISRVPVEFPSPQADELPQLSPDIAAGVRAELAAKPIQQTVSGGFPVIDVGLRPEPLRASIGVAQPFSGRGITKESEVFAGALALTPSERLSQFRFADIVGFGLAKQREAGGFGAEALAFTFTAGGVAVAMLGTPIETAIRESPTKAVTDIAKGTFQFVTDPTSVFQGETPVQRLAEGVGILAGGRVVGAASTIPGKLIRARRAFVFKRTIAKMDAARGTFRTDVGKFEPVSGARLGVDLKTGKVVRRVDVSQRGLQVVDPRTGRVIGKQTQLKPGASRTLREIAKAKPPTDVQTSLQAFNQQYTVFRQAGQFEGLLRRNPLTRRVEFNPNFAPGKITKVTVGQKFVQPLTQAQISALKAARLPAQPRTVATSLTDIFITGKGKVNLGGVGDARFRAYKTGVLQGLKGAGKKGQTAFSGFTATGDVLFIKAPAAISGVFGKLRSGLIQQQVLSPPKPVVTPTPFVSAVPTPPRIIPLFQPREERGRILPVGRLIIEPEVDIRREVDVERDVRIRLNEEAIQEEAQRNIPIFQPTTISEPTTRVTSRQRIEPEIIPVIQPIEEPAPPDEIIGGTTRPIPDTPTPTIPLLPDEEEEVVKPKGSFGYDTQVKQMGRFVKVNRVPRTRNSAINLGVEITDSTPARTFKITRGGRLPETARSPPLSNKLFKFTKRDSTYIEKTEYAIDSIGEFTDITLKGQASVRTGRRFI